jgi:hypothetical protein
MNAQVKYAAPMTEEERKMAAWKNTGGKPGDCRLNDYRGVPIDWDQFDKQSQYGWVIGYVIPLEMGGTDEPSNLRAQHWCDSLRTYETALMMNL